MILQSLFSALTVTPEPSTPTIATSPATPPVTYRPPHLPETIPDLQPYITCAQSITRPGQVVRYDNRLFFTWVPKPETTAQPGFLATLHACYRTFFDCVAKQVEPKKLTVLSVHPLLGIDLKIQLPILLQECDRFLKKNENYNIYIAKGGITADPWLWTTEIDKIFQRTRVQIRFQELLAHHQPSDYTLVDIEARNGLAALLQDLEEMLHKTAVKELTELTRSIVENEYHTANVQISDNQKSELQTLVQKGSLNRGDIAKILGDVERQFKEYPGKLQSIFQLSGILYSITSP